MWNVQEGIIAAQLKIKERLPFRPTFPARPPIFSSRSLVRTRSTLYIYIHPHLSVTRDSPDGTAKRERSGESGRGATTISPSPRARERATLCQRASRKGRVVAKGRLRTRHAWRYEEIPSSREPTRPDRNFLLHALLHFNALGSARVEAMKGTRAGAF